jgi:hypothetical protein
MSHITTKYTTHEINNIIEEKNLNSDEKIKLIQTIIKTEIKKIK